LKRFKFTLSPSQIEEVICDDMSPKDMRKVKTEDLHSDRNSYTRLLVKTGNEWIPFQEARTEDVVEAQNNQPSLFQAELIRFTARNRFSENLSSEDLEDVRKWADNYNVPYENQVVFAYYFPQGDDNGVWQSGWYSAYPVKQTRNSVLFEGMTELSWLPKENR